ncbi:DUF2442 domain-containing protein [Sphingomonas oryzagri]
MNISAKIDKGSIADERVADVRCDDASLIVDLSDGRTISVPLAWYPRLPRHARAARQLGKVWRRLRHPLARRGRGHQHRRAAARIARAEGCISRASRIA